MVTGVLSVIETGIWMMPMLHVGVLDIQELQVPPQEYVTT